MLATLSVLILYRSLYHLVLIIPVLALGALVFGSGSKRWLWVSMLICLPAVGWYAKNQALYGFFGSSSWMGSNRWRMVSENYTVNELEALADQGVIDPVAFRVKYFDRPSKFASFGFDKKSEIRMLSRDDYHNINMIDIANMHYDNAVRLIRHDPGHYVRNAIGAYGRFCLPSYETQFVKVNARKIAAVIRLTNTLHGVGVARWVRQYLGVNVTSWYSVAIPAVVVGFFWRGMIAAGISATGWGDFLRRHVAESLMTILVAFVSLVGSLFEYGENCRFKFEVEALIIAMILGLFFRRRTACRTESAAARRVGREMRGSNKSIDGA